MHEQDTALFARDTLDRAAHLRGAPQDLLARSDTRTAVLWRGKALFETAAGQRLAWLPADHPVLAEATRPPLFLGLRDGAALFAHDISAWEDPHADAASMGQFADQSVNRHPSLAEGQGFLDLRGTMSQLDPDDAGDIAGAKGIFSWHDSHPFCARCGAATQIAQAGWQRDCPTCSAHHFPRTDPVVIMLIVHGDRTLLGRSPGWPEGMYSLLAGFMEPGESIEAAVRRETREEAAIPVGQVGYITSQPWPFPASLMIGCWGAALDDSITIDPQELDDAIWVSREELLEQSLLETPRIRPARRGSIARFILDQWMDGSLKGPQT